MVAAPGLPAVPVVTRATSTSTGVAGPVVVDRVLAVQASLTGRDLVLLGWLYDHKMLTTAQIAHALFPSLDFAQRRLRKLVGSGVIARFRPQRAGGGSFSYHYVLTDLGEQIITAQRVDEWDIQDDQFHVRAAEVRRRRHRLTARANLEHLLGTNQFFIDLAAHARTHPGARLARWWPTARTGQLFAFVPVGSSLRMTGRPDGHGIWIDHTQEHTHEHEHGLGPGRLVEVGFWLEYDNSTEPLSTLVAKLKHYESFAVDHDCPPAMRAWPVLFSLESWRRETNLHRELATTRQGRPITVPVATTSRDRNHAARLGPADAVWWLHTATSTSGAGSGSTVTGEAGDHGRLRLGELPAVIRGAGFRSTG